VNASGLTPFRGRTGRIRIPLRIVIKGGAECAQYSGGEFVEHGGSALKFNDCYLNWKKTKENFPGVCGENMRQSVRRGKTKSLET